jgi:hypothetical protein
MPAARSGVEAEDAGDDAVERLRNQDLSRASTIRTTRVMIHLQVGGKQIQQIAERSTQHDGPRCSTAPRDDEVVFVRELFDEIEIRGPRTIGVLEFRMRKVRALGNRQ